jgi:hypothetical protein
MSAAQNCLTSKLMNQNKKQPKLFIINSSFFINQIVPPRNLKLCLALYRRAIMPVALEFALLNHNLI